MDFSHRHTTVKCICYLTHRLGWALPEECTCKGPQRYTGNMPQKCTEPTHHRSDILYSIVALTRLRISANCNPHPQATIIEEEKRILARHAKEKSIADSSHHLYVLKAAIKSEMTQMHSRMTKVDEQLINPDLTCPLRKVERS